MLFYTQNSVVSIKYNSNILIITIKYALLTSATLYKTLKTLTLALNCAPWYAACVTTSKEAC